MSLLVNLRLCRRKGTVSDLKQLIGERYSCILFNACDNRISRFSTMTRKCYHRFFSSE